MSEGWRIQLFITSLKTDPHRTGGSACLRLGKKPQWRKFPKQKLRSLLGPSAYVGKTSSGYDPFVYNVGISASEVEISDDVFIIKKETAEEFLKNRQSSQTATEPTTEPVAEGTAPPSSDPAQPTDRLFETSPPVAGDKVSRITWSGEVPPQKWSTFYNRVLAKFAVGQGLKLRVNVEVTPDQIVSAVTR